MTTVFIDLCCLLDLNFDWSYGKYQSPDERFLKCYSCTMNLFVGWQILFV
jgi:hypothetical protein